MFIQVGLPSAAVPRGYAGIPDAHVADLDDRMGSGSYHRDIRMMVSVAMRKSPCVARSGSPLVAS